MYSLHTEFGSWNDVSIDMNTYVHGNRLAISLLSAMDGFLCTLSTNIVEEELTDEKCFFVDTNNCPFAERFLVDNHLATPTGRLGLSGFCVYPEYRYINKEN